MLSSSANESSSSCEAIPAPLPRTLPKKKILPLNLKVPSSNQPPPNSEAKPGCSVSLTQRASGPRQGRVERLRTSGRAAVAHGGSETARTRGVAAGGQDVPSRRPSAAARGRPQASSAHVAISIGKLMKNHHKDLTAFELGEVLEYKQVWYWGQGRTAFSAAVPAKIHGAKQLDNNCGFDDDRGDLIVVPHDHIAYRFEILGLLGKGSFGQVLKAYDYERGEEVALKVIRNKKRFHQQALIEIKVLELLRDSDPLSTTQHCIVNTLCSFSFRDHLCIVFELLSINLYEFLKKQNFRGVGATVTRRFAVQLLQCLKYLKSQGVIHCDMKPENVLLMSTQKSAVKVIDFGSSCFQNERLYTYIQSRFYRAPEIILGLPYTCAIDMWSFGCVLAELFSGYPLFPGENEHDQLQCMMEVLGLPPTPLLREAPRRRMFFDPANGAPLLKPNSKGKKRLPASTTLREVLCCSDSHFLSFLEGCLRWDPADRLTPETAMAHEWVTSGEPAPPPPAHSATSLSLRIEEGVGASVQGAGGVRRGVEEVATKDREDESPIKSGRQRKVSTTERRLFGHRERSKTHSQGTVLPSTEDGTLPTQHSESVVKADPPLRTSRSLGVAQRSTGPDTKSQNSRTEHNDSSSKMDVPLPPTGQPLPPQQVAAARRRRINHQKTFSSREHAAAQKIDSEAGKTESEKKTTDLNSTQSRDDDRAPTSKHVRTGADREAGIPSIQASPSHRRQTVRRRTRDMRSSEADQKGSEVVAAVEDDAEKGTSAAVGGGTDATGGRGSLVEALARNRTRDTGKMERPGEKEAKKLPPI